MGEQGVLDEAHVNCCLDFFHNAHSACPRQGENARAYARTCVCFGGSAKERGPGDGEMTDTLGWLPGEVEEGWTDRSGKSQVWRCRLHGVVWGVQSL